MRVVAFPNVPLFGDPKGRKSVHARAPRPVHTNKTNLTRLTRNLFGFARATLAGLILSALAAGAAYAAPMMAVQGQQSVDNQGQFHYAIPIVVPPGTAGMVPHLALEYSSANTDGVEGYGWAIRGLPAITRCAQTVLLDGVHGGINYDSNDRFCLDGEEIQVTSGSYGDPGSKYDTASGRHYLIVANGSAGTGAGPAYFSVSLPNGVVMEFGNTAHSLIKASGGSVVRAWLVDKITDVHGNYMTVDYNNDNANGQAYPIEIDYTGNGFTHNPYNAVQFVYSSTTRGDVTPTYQAGYLQQFTTLLTHIYTYNGLPANGGTRVHDYQLAYRAGTSLLHSRLTSLTLCDGTDTSCLPQMNFAWQGGTGLPSVSTATSTLTPQFFGDFNGDGLLDIGVSGCPPSAVIKFGTTTAGSFSNALMNATYQYWDTGGQSHTHTGPACFTNFGLTPSTYYPAVRGYTDIVGVEPDANGDPFTTSLLNDYLNTNSFTQVSPPDTTLPEFDLLGDFDGNGVTDMLAKTTGANGTVYFGGFFGQPGTAVSGVGTNYAITEGDFDGDGCSDLLAVDATSSTIHFFCQPLSASTPVTGLSGSTLVPGDFNGDGKTDILAIGPSSAQLYLSSGEGLNPPITVTGVSSWAGYSVIVGDWNGDGKADIALISQTGGTHLVYLSTGTDFSSATSISDTGTSAKAVGANNDGADGIWFDGTNHIYYFPNTPELLASVDNGVGLTTSVTYGLLNENGSFYGWTSSAGANNVDGPYVATKKISFSNGTGTGFTNYHLSYSYAGGKADYSLPPVAAPKTNILTARILVMGELDVVDSRTGLKTVKKYYDSVPFIGLPSVVNVISSGTSINKANYDYSGTFHQGGPSPVAPEKVTIDRADLDGTPFQERVTELTPDSYGNITLAVTTGGSETQTVTNTYTNETTPLYVLGQLTETDIESQLVTSGGTLDSTRHYHYDRFGNGDLQNGYIEQGNTHLELETAYGYDGFGNPNSATQTGADIGSRNNAAQFDANGEFPTYFQDPLNRKTYISFDPRFGTLSSITDINSLVTQAGYDWAARPQTLIKPDLNQVITSYTYCSGIAGGSAPCPATGVYVIITTPKTSVSSGSSQNGAITKTYYDAFNRIIAVDTQAFDGSFSRVSSVYDDTSGRLLKTSRPYFVTGGTAQWTTYTLDALSRPTLITYPDASHTTYAYCGPTNSATDDKGHTKTIVRDDRGLISRVTDGQTGTVTSCVATGGSNYTYTYDEFANQLTAKNGGGDTTTNTFDLRGRKLTMDDPDLHDWQFDYDQVNGLLSQTDAKGNGTAIGYNSFEQPLTRDEHDSSGTTHFYSKWLWNVTNGQGKLQNACTDQSNCPSANYQQKPTYDTLSRVAAGKLVLDGTTYTYTPHYNSDGRVDTLTYPSGFVAEYDYNSYGYLAQIKDHTTGSSIWQANTADAELHVTQQTEGSGSNPVVVNQGYDPQTGNLLSICATTSVLPCNGNVQNMSFNWDTVGNLNYRTDTLHSYTENFCYDELDRLTNAAVASTCTGGSSPKTYVYNPRGDITKKSDICSTAGCFHYDGTGGAGPHELTSIDGTYNGVTNPTFAYDANGNLTGGAGRSFTYTPFNMTDSITQGPDSASLAYGAWHNRYKMCVPGCSGSPTKTTYYLYDPETGGMSEKIVSGASTTWIDYIIAPGAGLVAIRTTAGSSISTRYVVKDHLGSVTSLVNNSVTPTVESDSYDPWGKRRNPDGTDAACGSVSSQTTRGYTQQEMLDTFCLTNMNARIQDPSLGRFLSADKYVLDRYSTQAWNRTCYVQNNPLNHIDPTGNVENVIVWGTRWHINLIDSTYVGTSPQGLTSGGGGGGEIETVIVTAQRHKDDKDCSKANVLNAFADAASPALGNGTVYSTQSISAAAGIGMFGSVTYFSNTATGQYGYFRSAGFSVGFGGGASVETGMISGSPIDLMNSYSLNLAAFDFDLSVLLDSHSHRIGGGLPIGLSGDVPVNSAFLATVNGSTDNYDFTICNEP